jgi:hypothetical protein
MSSDENQIDKARSLYIHLGRSDEKPLLVSKTAFARPIKRDSNSSPTRGTFWKFHGVEEPETNEARAARERREDQERTERRHEEEAKRRKLDEKRSSTMLSSEHSRHKSATGLNSKNEPVGAIAADVGPDALEEIQINHNNNLNSNNSQHLRSSNQKQRTRPEYSATQSIVDADAEDNQLRGGNDGGGEEDPNSSMTTMVAAVKERRRRQLEDRAALLAEREAAKKQREEVQTLSGDVLDKLNAQEHRRRELLVAMSNTQWLHVVDIGRAAQISIALGERHVGRTLAASTAKRTQRRNYDNSNNNNNTSSPERNNVRTKSGGGGNTRSRSAHS